MSLFKSALVNANHKNNRFIRVNFSWLAGCGHGIVGLSQSECLFYLLKSIYRFKRILPTIEHGMDKNNILFEGRINREGESL